MATTTEHSERARYVTDQIALWIVNDGDWYQYAADLAGRDLDELRRFLTSTLKEAPRFAAPWHVAQELAPNDYDRIDWTAVARQLTD